MTADSFIMQSHKILFCNDGAKFRRIPHNEISEEAFVSKFFENFKINRPGDWQ